jgi:hypothetical protein
MVTRAFEPFQINQTLTFEVRSTFYHRGKAVHLGRPEKQKAQDQRFPRVIAEIAETMEAYSNSLHGQRKARCSACKLARLYFK